MAKKRSPINFEFDSVPPASAAIGPWLNYHHLYYFWVIANEGSISKASEKLRLGQPTLSTQLKIIEDQLGQKLFDRRNRRLFLTESGKVAYQYASDIFRLGQEFIAVMQDKKPTQDIVHLSLGLLDGIPKNTVAKLVQAAFEYGPVSVSILEGKSDELLQDLALHKLDLVLMNFPPSLDEKGKIETKLIGRKPVAVYGGSEFKSLQKGFPASLSAQPFILPTFHSKIRHDIEAFFKSQKLQLSSVAETQDLSLQHLLATDGLGVFATGEDQALSQSLFRLGRFPNLFEEYWFIKTPRKVENPVANFLFESWKLSDTFKSKN